MSYATDTSPLVFDLETCGLPNSADFLEPVTPDARLKDPEKIAADIEAKTAARLEKVALDWNVGQIAALGWWIEGQGVTACKCRTEADEAVLLGAFWSE